MIFPPRSISALTYAGFVQKIVTIFPGTFQGLFKDQIEFSRTPYQGGNLTDGI